MDRTSKNLLKYTIGLPFLLALTIGIGIGCILKDVFVLVASIAMFLIDGKLDFFLLGGYSVIGELWRPL